MDASHFSVAIICALPVEMAAAEGMLDEEYEDLPRKEHDSNNYRYGRIGKHNVVLACLPAGVTGTVSAASVAENVLHSFKKFKMGLMVGIGGGVPDIENDMRLGDVVVSKPTSTFGGVVQYDMGKTIQGGEFTRTGSLNRPPDALLTAVAALEAKHIRRDSDVPRYITEMTEKYPKMRATFRYQGHECDKLFEASYEHPSTTRTCKKCDPDRLIPRSERRNITIHYGTIASGNQVMRHGLTRDRIAADLEVLCFEMEATGLMNRFPCLVIRGICDYADSHKNKQWQPYAAAAAAAYAKELLYTIPADKVDSLPAAPPVASSSGTQSSNNVYGGVHNQGGQQFNQSSFSGNISFGIQNNAQQGASFSQSPRARAELPSPQRSITATHEGLEDFYRAFRANPNINLEVRDPVYGKTPLHLTASCDRPLVSEELIHAGAEIDAKDFNGSTPLHLACGGGKIEIASLLLDAGANINALTYAQLSPLFYAVKSNHKHTVGHLLRRGADTTLRVNGETAFDLARRIGNDDIIRALQGRN